MKTVTLLIILISFLFAIKNDNQPSKAEEPIHVQVYLEKNVDSVKSVLKTNLKSSIISVKATQDSIQVLSNKVDSVKNAYSEMTLKKNKLDSLVLIGQLYGQVHR